MVYLAKSLVQNSTWLTLSHSRTSLLGWKEAGCFYSTVIIGAQCMFPISRPLQYVLLLTAMSITCLPPFTFNDNLLSKLLFSSLGLWALFTVSTWWAQNGSKWNYLWRKSFLKLLFSDKTEHTAPFYFLHWYTSKKKRWDISMNIYKAHDLLVPPTENT